MHTWSSGSDRHRGTSQPSGVTPICVGTDICVFVSGRGSMSPTPYDQAPTERFVRKGMRAMANRHASQEQHMAKAGSNLIGLLRSGVKQLDCPGLREVLLHHVQKHIILRGWDPRVTNNHAAVLSKRVKYILRNLILFVLRRLEETRGKVNLW